ncbi:hypothetical protein Nmel_013045 [Mimus melanotis]
MADGNISTFNSVKWDTSLIRLFNAMAMNKPSLLNSPSQARQNNYLFPEMRQKQEFKIKTIKTSQPALFSAVQSPNMQMREGDELPGGSGLSARWSGECKG